MAYTPIPLGQTHVKLALTWQDDNGTAIDLTGATITGRIRSVHGTGAATTGTIAVVSAPAGTLTYTFAAAEVGTAGQYELQFKATYADSTILLHNILQFEVQAVV